MRIVDSFIPVRVPSERFDETIAYYEHLQNDRCRLRFRYEPGKLDIATVGAVVLIGGSGEALANAPVQHMVVSVDSLARWRQHLVGVQGATVVRGPADIPTGKNMYVRNPDGSLFEYVELAAKKVATVNTANRVANTEALA